MIVAMKAGKENTDRTRGERERERKQTRRYRHGEVWRAPMARRTGHWSRFIQRGAKGTEEKTGMIFGRQFGARRKEKNTNVHEGTGLIAVTLMQKFT